MLTTRLACFRCRRTRLCSLIALFCFAAPFALAQKPAAVPAANLLKKPVHLQMGETTLGQVTAALSAQTGLKVEAEEVLRGHRVVVQITGVSADDVLLSLAELNDWRMIEPQPGRIIITTKRFYLPRSANDIPDALAAAFPKDFRRYLGIKESLGKLPDDVDPAIQSRIDEAKRFPNPVHGPEKIVEARVRVRLNALTAQAQTEFMQALTLAKTDARPFLTVRLPREQQQALLAVFVFAVCQASSFDLLHGNWKPFQKDWTQAELTLENGVGLMIGTTTHIGGGTLYQGFGGQVLPGPEMFPPDRPLPAP